MQIMNVFLYRSRRQSIFSQGIFGNPLVLWGVLLEIALILFIDYTPFGIANFGTAPIDGRVWLFIIPFAFLLLVLEELRKWLARTVANTRVGQKTKFQPKRYQRNPSTGGGNSSCLLVGANRSFAAFPRFDSS